MALTCLKTRCQGGPGTLVASAGPHRRLRSQRGPGTGGRGRVGEGQAWGEPPGAGVRVGATLEEAGPSRSGSGRGVWLGLPDSQLPKTGVGSG